MTSGPARPRSPRGSRLASGSREPVTSPTFTLVRQYRWAGTVRSACLLHADMWRLDHLHEVVDLGLGELVEDGAVALVEWGDVAEPVLGAGALAVDSAPGRRRGAAG